MTTPLPPQAPGGGASPPGLRDWPALSADYASYHTTPGNRLCHLIGIPLIVMAVLDWTQRPFGSPLPLAWALLPVYFSWATRLGVAMMMATAVLATIARTMPWWGPVLAFLAGWALQFIGHKTFEKNSPALFKDLLHLLVGPALLLDRYFPSSPASES